MNGRLYFSHQAIPVCLLPQPLLDFQNLLKLLVLQVPIVVHLFGLLLELGQPAFDFIKKVLQLKAKYHFFLFLPLGLLSVVEQEIIHGCLTALGPCLLIGGERLGRIFVSRKTFVGLFIGCASQILLENQRVLLEHLQVPWHALRQEEVAAIVEIEGELL